MIAYGCLLLTVLAVVNSSAVNGTKPLYIVGLFPLSGKAEWSSFHGPRQLKAVEKAVADINNSTDILPDYELILISSDTEANRITTLQHVFEFVNTPPMKTAIIGPIFSYNTEVVAEMTSRWHVVEITMSALSELRDRQRYPYTYSTTIPMAELTHAQSELIQLFGWKKIAILYQTIEPYIGAFREFQLWAEQSDVTVVATASFYSDPTEAVERLKDSDARIIMGYFASYNTRWVFCNIYRASMYGVQYVWMMPGSSMVINGWWSVEEEGITCTPEELKTASEGTLAIGWSYNGREEVTTVAGMTPAQYRKQMEALVGGSVPVQGFSSWATLYDAVWTLALALHDAQEELVRPLDSYSTGEKEHSDVVCRWIQRQVFQGVSGPVRFSENGIRIGVLLIEQHINGSQVTIGTYDMYTELITWLVNTQDIWYYSGGKIPYDSDITQTITQLQSSSSHILLTVSVLSGIGTTFAFCFIVFNIVKRKHRQVKMSSPNVNNAISIGIILAYLCVALMGVDRSMVEEHVLLNICKVRSWGMALSFTIAFGGMFTKMWRVYSIVIHNKTKRKVIKDRHLFIIMAVLMLIDLAILIPWQIIDPIHIKKQRVQVPQTEEDVAEYRKYELLYVNCTSAYDTIWTMVLIIYKTFLVVFGAFLAWSTRNVSVPGLNDSYYVGLSIYNTVICCVVAVPLSLLNVSSISVTYALVAGFLLLCTTMTLCMLFIPKIIAVYRRNAVDQQINFTGTGGGTISRANRELTKEQAPSLSNQTENQGHPSTSK